MQIRAFFGGHLRSRDLKICDLKPHGPIESTLLNILLLIIYPYLILKNLYSDEKSGSAKKNSVSSLACGNAVHEILGPRDAQV